MTEQQLQAKVDEYAKRPFAVDIQWDSQDELFVAKVVEVNECTGHGSSRVEAMEMALDNLRDWIADALEVGESVPEPAPIVDLPSGKWVQRVPRSMHADLAECAASEGVSLNQLVVSMLARELGQREAVRPFSVHGIESCADPSTSYLTAIREELAVTLSWDIQPVPCPGPIQEQFIGRMVRALPTKTKVESLESYAEKADHSTWN